MRLLAFTDFHVDGASLEAIRKKSKAADLLVCCGDLTVFGHGLEEAVTFLDSIGKKTLVIHGNHESQDKLEALCKRAKNLVFLHRNMASIDDFTFLGFGGEGFAKTAPGFEIWSSVISKGLKPEKTVLVVHQPPYGTKTDYLAWAGHVGNKSFQYFIYKFQPKLVLCGHLHETFNVHDKIKDSVVLNPGPDGTFVDI